MSAVNCTCPHCDRAVTITSERRSVNSHELFIDNSDGRRSLQTVFTVCPNPDCRKLSLAASLWEVEPVPGDMSRRTKIVKRWPLIPESSSKQFPDYIPETIRNDYHEACLIRDLSPKASATLSRRCLQGILRDFWKVKPARLVDEIEEIRPKVDEITWTAITAVRKLGNIGAHMEKDINLIIDVEPEEAGQLISLVETLLQEWYVARYVREKRMNAVIETAEAKSKADKRAVSSHQSSQAPE